MLSVLISTSDGKCLLVCYHFVSIDFSPFLFDQTFNMLWLWITTLESNRLEMYLVSNASVMNCNRWVMELLFGGRWRLLSARVSNKFAIPYYVQFILKSSLIRFRKWEQTLGWNSIAIFFKMGHFVYFRAFLNTMTSIAKIWLRKIVGADESTEVWRQCDQIGRCIGIWATF